MKLGEKFLVLALCIFALAAVAPFLSHADTAEDLAGKISTQNKAISDLETEIAGYQQQLGSLGQQKNTLSNALATLGLQAKKLNADISVTEDEIAAQNLHIESLGNSIVQTGNSIDDLKTAIAQNLREIQAQDDTSITSVLLTGATLSDVWHYAGEQDAFRTGLQEKTSQLGATKDALIGNKAQVEQAKADLVKLEGDLNDQKAIVQKNQNQKNSLLSSTKNQEAAYQKLVKQKQTLKTQLESDLHDYESRLKYVLNPKLLPPAGSSPLAWPLDHIVITQLFGKTVAAARLYVTGSHNGVDFGAPVGTPVKAMATGTVVGSGNSDIACPGASYGNWIFIKYDNGLASVFGHLSLVKAKTGARVSPGDVVAYSGATGYATGPHLHVSIFANDGVSINSFPSKACPGRTITIPTAAANAYLDPMLYLPKQ